jgi:hypothetical protein
MKCEDVNFALDVTGATALSMSAAMALVLFSGGDLEDLLSSLQFLGVGAASLIAARIPIVKPRRKHR